MTKQKTTQEQKEQRLRKYHLLGLIVIIGILYYLSH